MDTLTKSCSRTIVIAANGEVQTHEETAVYVKELDVFLTMKVSKTRQQYCRLKSFAMKTDILMNGSTVKNHISLKTGFGYNATRKTSFLSWFQACQRVLPQARLPHPGTVVPERKFFGDLKTADHKVLSKGCESRNNHRYAVVVQDLATQWIQSYTCKTKTSQRPRKAQ